MEVFVPNHCGRRLVRRLDGLSLIIPSTFAPIALSFATSAASAERPFEVGSVSVVESRARDLGCVHCEGPPRVEGQDAVRIEDRVRARVVRARSLRGPATP